MEDYFRALQGMTLEKPQVNPGNVGLPPSKHLLIDKYLKKHAARKPEAKPTIPARPAGEPIPLSFAQQQVWLHSQMAGDTPIYNEAITIYRLGPLDLKVFELCLVEILRRHEIWRTTFDTIDGDPIQVVQSVPHGFPLEMTDVRHLEESERDREARRLATENAQKPFDLKKGPLLRAIVVRLDEEKYRVYMTFHQLVFDAVSAYRVFLPELSALYEAFSAGRRSSLPEPTLQYGDFAYWEQKTFADETWSNQLLFWREKLAGDPPILSWPNHRPRPLYETHRGNVERLRFDPAVVPPLRAFCQHEGVSSYMVLLASYVALLNRYTAQEDIVIGALSAGRRWPEVERLAGDFVNPLPLRLDLSGNPTFRELTKRVMHVVLDALTNERVPFERIVKGLQLRPDPSRSSIFQIILSKQPQLRPICQGWNLATEEVSNGASKLDLMIVIDERPDSISGPITYNTDLFDTSTITRMVEHWQKLLEGGLAQPDSCISELPLLTGVERTQLLLDWNNTVADYPKDKYLHDLVQAQAERTPDAVAAEFEGVRLSYRELNARSNQLAHYLRKLGVGPNVLVGVCMERSLEMLVALLGIMKAGGAYVPLDPSFPQDRLAYMVEDSQMLLLVTHREVDKNLRVRPGFVVRLDSDWPEIAKQSTDSPTLLNASPQNLAYVLYTSGSTGKPKGVEIPHSALMNFVVSMQREPGFTAGDVMLAVSSVSFDIAGLELYVPLASGGKVVIASREEARDPVRLIARMRDSRCNVMQATPATWQALIDAGWQGSPDLRVLCGGESLPRPLAQALLGRCAELWNMYGPTETTIWSAIHRVTSADGPIPCGQPIANTQLFVLDRHRNLVPPGIIGELYIGGSGLAQGYLRRPELTQERFIESPFEPKARLYRTGDLSRWLPDGTVECLGRNDNQVKIRGFRIELGEIEAVLGRHEAVSQCVVVAREQAPNEKVLVAYIEPRPGLVPDINDLRTRLRRQLPDYMLPSAIVLMDKLPLTPNGKIDRKALPPPAVRVEVEGQSVPPRDELERAVAKIWAKILRVKRVGIKDNFFELGGHSLAAVRMLSEVCKVTGKTLPLATLFQASTVEALAELIRREGWTPNWSSLVPVQPLGSNTPLFLVHGAEGNVLLYRNLARYLGPDQPVYGLQSQGLNGDGRLDTAVEEMASRYLREVTIAQPHGPYVLGGYCLGGIIAFEMAQQLSALGEKVDLVVMLDTYNPSLTSRTRLISKAPLHFLQNLWFHGANVALLAWNDREEFLRQKIAIELTRLQIRLHAGGHALRRVCGWKTQHEYPHLVIKKVNDQAAIRYRPQPYAGRVAVIRPKGSFLGLASASLGWDEIVGANLEVHQLPVYPKGMLIEPFCQVLAETLKRCLENV
jgi:surfactin family lipopeptide synthetase A